jgi:hypothetical protein
MSLWVFGDSFSVSRDNINNGQDNEFPLWTELVTTGLGFSTYNNYSQWGVSNEYIINQFMEHHREFESGDYVIIQLTNANRQWFFKNSPELANIYIGELKKAVTKSQMNAVNSYVKYLDRGEINFIRYNLLDMALKYISHELSHIKILIIPAFHPIDGVTGTLMEVCNGEFVSEESLNKWYEATNDSRPNHLSASNHIIYGKKILEAFGTGRLLDFTTGFEKEFI